ncbi:hypothetical protein ACROSR_10235 [Roseovarius tibetensis]|uniref:hypothetical protein n=1 Tax=Roseovarius tibetensis TaxID=2685897 RepID=UPI003D7FBE6F
MIDPNGFHNRLLQVQTAFSEKLRVRGRTFEQQVRRAGRRLPRRQRRAATTILGAQDWMAHPKLARILDFSEVDAAFSDLHAHLDRVDPAEDRKTALLRVLASIVLNLLGLAVLIHVLIRWRGLG